MINVILAFFAASVLGFFIWAFTNKVWIGVLFGILIFSALYLSNSPTKTPVTSKPVTNTPVTNKPVMNTPTTPAPRSAQLHTVATEPMTSNLRQNPPPQPIHPDDTWMYEEYEHTQTPFKRGHNDQRGLPITFTTV